MTDDATRKELVRLIERERDIGGKFIEGIVGNSFTVRGWAITVWSVLVGLAVNKASWEFGLLGAVAVTSFALIDVYYTWLYVVALNYVRSTEALTFSYFKTMIRFDIDPDAQADLDLDLGMFRLGLFSQFPKLRLGQVKRAIAGRWFFRLVYPALITIAVAISILAATGTIRPS